MGNYLGTTLNEPVVVTNPDGSDITENLPQAMNDEAIWLLRRMVKLMESQAVVDSFNRQKVTIDYMTPGMGAQFGVGVSLVGNGVTNAGPILATLYPLPTWEGPVEQRWRVMEDAHQAYQLGIRQHLSFT